MEKLKNEYKSKVNEYCKLINLQPENLFKDPKQEYRYFCYRHIDLVNKIKISELKLNLDNEAVLVEFRILPHLEFLLINTILKLGNNWSYTIVCGLDNYEFMKKLTNKLSPNIKLIKLNYKDIDIDLYSKMLMSQDFWKLFYGTKILIWQEDSCIFQSNINDFIKWDYIGAPWPRNDNSYGVGNGGLSLRTKSIMIDIIKKITPNDTQLYYTYDNTIPEDVYFTTNMIKYKIGNLATKNEAIKFSDEQYQYSKSFGGHNFFTHNKNWKDLMYSRVILNYLHD